MTQRPYVSIDIETTGLDPSYCQVIEFGAVIDDWTTPVEDLKRFHCYVYHDKIVGEPFALAMNAEILRRIASVQKEMQGTDATGVNATMFYRPKAAGRMFADWLKQNDIDPVKAVLAAGKNFAGFDRPFLNEMPGFSVPFHRRVIDPAMLFWNPETDPEPPDTKTCMERAGTTGEVAHTAIEDALGVIKMVRFAAAREKARAAGVELIADHRRGV